MDLELNDGGYRENFGSDLAGRLLQIGGQFAEIRFANFLV